MKVYMYPFVIFPVFIQALVNVPALSERTLRRDIEKTDISTGPEIQVLYYMYMYMYVYVYKGH